MSRGVRDLRDLICVSRLTFRDTDEDQAFSDDGIDGRMSQMLDTLSLSSGGSDSRQGSAISCASFKKSSDSGFHTNGTSMDLDIQTKSNILLPHPDADKPAAARKKKRKKKKLPNSLPGVGDLPGIGSLQPFQSDSPFSRSSSASSSDGFHSVEVPHADTQPLGPIQATRRKRKQWDRPKGNFDDLMPYLDVTLIGDWLQQANNIVGELSEWVHFGENFVLFAHFWLSDFPDAQRQDIFQLEVGILRDHLGVAFASGLDSGTIKPRDLSNFLEAVFLEYPSKLLSSKGSYLFLDYLDVLTTDRKDSYRTLLTDVRCSTKVKQYAQWTLAVRAFTLVSVWSAVINFYRNLTVNSVIGGLRVLSSLNTKSDLHHQRTYMAIRNNFVDVLNYFIRSGKVDPNIKDSHNKSLVMHAVVLNKPDILNYLLTQVKPCPDVNAAADTGNSPLHAAANVGNAALVRALLAVPDIIVDQTNSQCDNATPLHLAIMHGHSKVVELLLQRKASQYAKMGDLTIQELARDFADDGVNEVLKRYGVH